MHTGAEKPLVAGSSTLPCHQMAQQGLGTMMLPSCTMYSNTPALRVMSGTFPPAMKINQLCVCVCVCVSRRLRLSPRTRSNMQTVLWLQVPTEGSAVSLGRQCHCPITVLLPHYEGTAAAM